MIDPIEKLRIVELKKHDPEWFTLFKSASHEIQSILKDNLIHIHHIGSTAIPNMDAKPIVDMLPVVKNINEVDALNGEFETLGYVCMGEYGSLGRRFYFKSLSSRTHHIHLFEEGNSEISRHVAFKEFMLKNPDYAQAYSLIKRNLADVFYTDIENYVNGKSSFVQRIDYQTGTARAKQLDAQDDIIIEPYHPAWPKLAEAEIKSIQMISKLPHVLIEHIGSTAVPNLSSKPIIDIFIAIPSIQDAHQWIKPLENLGYVFWDQNPDKLHLRFFKGMPPFGMKRTHHVHIVEASNPRVAHWIAFRNILRQNETIKLAYETLKLELSKTHSSDREAYTNQKSEFIKKTLLA